MPTILFVVMLLIPGMPEPQVQKVPVESYEACVAQVASMQEQYKKHASEEFKIIVGYEVTNQKSNPA
jgi:hypothetical protein